MSRRYVWLFRLILGISLILIASSAPASSTAPMSTASPGTLVFMDSFEDGIPDGWLVDITWSIEADNGDMVLHGQVPTGGYSCCARIKGRKYGDFTVQANVKLLEGDASMFFRTSAVDGSYEVTLGPDAIDLAKERNGNSMGLDSFTPGLKYGQWYNLSITAEGRAITIELDGVPIITVSDAVDPVLFGEISFENRGHFHLDDVAIELDIPAVNIVDWSSTADLPGGGVWAISIASSNPDIIYLATQKNNLYRSEDGGQTWTPKGTDLGAHIFAPIAIRPDDPDVIYLSNGQLHFSQDGGDNFVCPCVGSGDSEGIQAIAIYEKDPDIIYAGDDTGTVYKTVNGGQTGPDWNPVAVLGPDLNIRTLLVHPTDPDRLFASVRDNGIYTSTDGGLNWTKVLSIQPSDQSLSMDPSNPERLYVADGDTVYHTIDAGVTWEPLASFPPEPNHLVNAISDPQRLYVSTQSGIYRSDDGGESWSPTAFDTGVFGPVLGMAVAPDDADLVYVGIQDGVVLSSDGGASWLDSSDGIVDLDVWQLDAPPTNYEQLYGGTLCMRGLFRSADAGTTWAWVPEHFHYVMEIAVVPSQPNVLYLTDHDGLFKSLDEGNTWSHVVDAGNAHLHGLAVDPLDPDIAYVGSVGSGEYSAPYSTIYKTTDGGISWHEINNGFPMTDVSVHVIAVDRADTDVIYAGTYSGGLFHDEGSGLGISKSTNAGEAWAPINNGLTTLNVASLAIDPFNSEIVYAGTDRGLFITTGAGNEWTLLDGAPKDLINAIVPDPSMPGRFYISTQVSGMFLTTNGGANWASLNSGLPFPPFPLGDLVLDPADGVLYVAVRGAGVFRGTVKSVRNLYLPVLNIGQ